MTDDHSKTTPARQRAPSVAIAFQTLGRTLRHAYEHIGTLIIISALWYVGALLILPIGVATAALYRVTRPMAEERSTRWREFFTHLRGDTRWASEHFALLFFGFSMITVNLRFYNAAPWPILRYAATLFIALLVIWTGMTLYAFPLALRQKVQRLTTTLRNAWVMVLSNAPGVLLSLLLLLLISIPLLLVPPLFVLLPGLIALWGQENARLLLVASGFIPRDEFADRPLEELDEATASKARRRSRR